MLIGAWNQFALPFHPIRRDAKVGRPTATRLCSGRDTRLFPPQDSAFHGHLAGGDRSSGDSDWSEVEMVRSRP